MNDLDKALLTRLKDLREHKGSKVDVYDMEPIIESFMNAIIGYATVGMIRSDKSLYNEIKAIAEQIRATKQEISGLEDEDLGGDDIPDATMELSAVVSATEEATNIILDSTEAIQNIAAELDDEEKKAKIDELAIKIFESCNFQDITGQRINKVVQTLDNIEKRVMPIMQAFIDTSEGGGSKEGTSSKKKEKDSGNPDLGGPQLDGVAPTQDEIDALFDSID